MSKQNRTNKPITVTLTPESIEGIEILKQELGEKTVSRVVDTAIKETASNYGYELLEEGEEMKVDLICRGRVLTRHLHTGNTYIEAPDDGEYIIKIYNNSYLKRLAVISVDGVNILNGEDAGFEGPGYVLAPYQTIEINGWHRTNEETAAFTFEALKDSYASQTGRGESNVGVIGVAVFNEKQDHRFWRQQRYLSSNSGGRRTKSMSRGGGGLLGGQISAHAGSAMGGGDMNYGATMDSFSLDMDLGRETLAIPASANAAPEELTKVGTGYGERKSMQTRETTFERSTQSPAQVMAIRYATSPMLVKWGVIKEPEAPAPNPFPASVGVAPPANWKG
jgi:hypothetical protein